MDRKCSLCRRRCYLVMTCRCEKTFCIEHKDPEDHECGFDYKSYGKDLLEKQNPKIKAQKIEAL
jgi:predicted nucleic acid binding AN1-type Zn finger protein